MGNKQDILPGLSTDGLKWQTVDFTELGTTNLVPGLILTGLRKLSDYNVFEDRAIGQLAASRQPGTPDIASQCESAAKSRLSEGLRLPGYHGLVPGEVYMFSFDHDRIAQYPGGSYRPPSFLWGLTGLIVFHTQRFGMRAQEVSYYQSTDGLARRYDAVRRAFGGRQQMQEARDLAVLRVQQSITRADKVAQFALRHVYLGGSPGTGSGNR